MMHDSSPSLSAEEQVEPVERVLWQHFCRDVSADIQDRMLAWSAISPQEDSEDADAVLDHKAQKLFRHFDTDSRGRLGLEEHKKMYEVIEGGVKLRDNHAFAQEYAALCTKVHADPKKGLDLDQFTCMYSEETLADELESDVHYDFRKAFPGDVGHPKETRRTVFLKMAWTLILVTAVDCMALVIGLLCLLYRSSFSLIMGGYLVSALLFLRDQRSEHDFDMLRGLHKYTFLHILAQSLFLFFDPLLDFTGSKAGTVLIQLIGLEPKNSTHDVSIYALAAALFAWIIAVSELQKSSAYSAMRLNMQQDQACAKARLFLSFATRMLDRQRALGRIEKTLQKLANTEKRIRSRRGSITQWTEHEAKNRWHRAMTKMKTNVMFAKGGNATPSLNVLEMETKGVVALGGEKIACEVRMGYEPAMMTPTMEPNGTFVYPNEKHKMIFSPNNAELPLNVKVLSMPSHKVLGVVTLENLNHLQSDDIVDEWYHLHHITSNKSASRGQLRLKFKLEDWEFQQWGDTEEAAVSIPRAQHMDVSEVTATKFCNCTIHLDSIPKTLENQKNLTSLLATTIETFGEGFAPDSYFFVQTTFRLRTEKLSWALVTFSNERIVRALVDQRILSTGEGSTPMRVESVIQEKALSSTGSFGKTWLEAKALGEVEIAGRLAAHGENRKNADLKMWSKDRLKKLNELDGGPVDFDAQSLFTEMNGLLGLRWFSPKRLATRVILAQRKHIGVSTAEAAAELAGSSTADHVAIFAQHVLITQSQRICYFMIVLDLWINQNLFSALLFVSLVGCVMCEDPHVPSGYWAAMVYWLQFEITLRYLLAIPYLEVQSDCEEYAELQSAGAETHEGSPYPFICSAVGPSGRIDVLLVTFVCILIHEYKMKRQGLWLYWTPYYKQAEALYHHHLHQVADATHSSMHRIDFRRWTLSGGHTFSGGHSGDDDPPPGVQVDNAGLPILEFDEAGDPIIPLDKLGRELVHIDEDDLAHFVDYDEEGNRTLVHPDDLDQDGKVFVADEEVESLVPGQVEGIDFLTDDPEDGGGLGGTGVGVGVGGDVEKAMHVDISKLDASGGHGSDDEDDDDEHHFQIFEHVAVSVIAGYLRFRAFVGTFYSNVILQDEMLEAEHIERMIDMMGTKNASADEGMDSLSLGPRSRKHKHHKGSKEGDEVTGQPLAALFRKSSYKIPVDLYGPSLCIEFTSMILVLFGLEGDLSSDALAGVSSGSFIDGTLIVMTVLQFAFIVMDRAANLSQSIPFKFFLQWLSLIVYLIIIFGVWEWNNSLAILFVLKTVYWMLGAIQIRKGYPHDATQTSKNKMIGETHMLRHYSAIVIHAIPFVDFMRSVLSWTFNKTTMRYEDCVRFDEIMNMMFIIKCKFARDDELKRKVGHPQATATKVGMGSFLMLQFFLYAWGPMIVITFMDDIVGLQLNNVRTAAVKLDLSIGATPMPLFETQYTTVSGVVASRTPEHIPVFVAPGYPDEMVEGYYSNLETTLCTSLFEPAMESFDPNNLFKTRCDDEIFKLYSEETFDQLQVIQFGEYSDYTWTPSSQRLETSREQLNNSKVIVTYNLEFSFETPNNTVSPPPRVEQGMLSGSAWEQDRVCTAMSQVCTRPPCPVATAWNLTEGGTNRDVLKLMFSGEPNLFVPEPKTSTLCVPAGTYYPLLQLGREADESPVELDDAVPKSRACLCMVTDMQDDSRVWRLLQVYGDSHSLVHPDGRTGLRRSGGGVNLGFGLAMLTASQKIPTGVAQSVASVGLVGLYVTVVLNMARGLKLARDKLLRTLIYEDRDAADFIYQLCQDLLTARKFAKLDPRYFYLEERLWLKLQFLFRDTGELLNMTLQAKVKRTHEREEELSESSESSDDDDDNDNNSPRDNDGDGGGKGGGDSPSDSGGETPRSARGQRAVTFPG